MSTDTTAIDAVLEAGPVMAVVVIHDAAQAPGLARALTSAGVAIEVTLRTPAALEAIRAIRIEVPEALVGAGTVLNAGDLKRAEAAGATFAVSPGATADLLAAGVASAIPFLPGAATASEVMAGVAAGYSRFKFFPASAVGGPAAIKALAGPFANLRFCPTGGISLETARSYLDLPNVSCVGGSWLTPDAAVTAGDWPAIEALAAQARSVLGR